MSALEIEHVRQQWAVRRRPDELARIKVLESDLMHVELAGPFAYPAPGKVR